MSEKKTQVTIVVASIAALGLIALAIINGLQLSELNNQLNTLETQNAHMLQTIKRIDDTVNPITYQPPCEVLGDNVVAQDEYLSWVFAGTCAVVEVIYPGHTIPQYIWGGCLKVNVPLWTEVNSKKPTFRVTYTKNVESAEKLALQKVAEYPKDSNGYPGIDRAGVLQMHLGDTRDECPLRSNP